MLALSGCFFISRIQCSCLHARWKSPTNSNGDYMWGEAGNRTPGAAAHHDANAQRKSTAAVAVDKWGEEKIQSSMLQVLPKVCPRHRIRSTLWSAHWRADGTVAIGRFKKHYDGNTLPHVLGGLLEGVGCLGAHTDESYWSRRQRSPF